MMRYTLIKDSDLEYLLYDDGSVFSCTKNKFLKKKIRSDGYYVVSIKTNGKSKWLPVHRLLAKHFIPNHENKPCVNHKDGNKLNNCIENLEWVTYSENNEHAFRTKLREPVRVFGEKHGLSRLTKEKVRYIRENYQPRHKEFGQHALARKFGVNQYAVWAVVHDKVWKGV